MSDNSAIDPAPKLAPPRRNTLGILLLIILWLFQVRYPPLSYPALGLCLLPLLAAMALLLPLRAFSAAHSSVASRIRQPALLPGFALVIWVLMRWAVAGFPARGASTVGTVLWTAGYLAIAFILTATSAQGTENHVSSDSYFSRTFILCLSALGLGCGIHAVWQYHFIYLDSYQALLASIGSRAPDRTEAALLHHLNLRRVAGIWGDPNTLATFSAISLCASLELMVSRLRPLTLTRSISVLSGIACVAAIYYTASRGGALDAVGVGVVYTGFIIWRNKSCSRPHLGIVGLILVAAVLGALPGHTSGQAEPLSAAKAPQTESSGWVWRSDTIRERLFYVQVGAQMIRLAPLAGLGPGSVELYFGRLKPAEARETKYLHNWVVQTWAETGMVGLVLMTWFLAALTWRTWQARLWHRPFDRALAVIFFLIVFDGLLQVSWNQREIMATFGIVCGILMARTGSVRASSPSAILKAARLTGFLSLGAIFVMLEAPFLAGANSKQMARDAMYVGDLVEAEKQWKRATQWLPRDPEPYAARASIAINQKELSAARMLIDKALELNPDSASAHVQAADIDQRLGQNTEAFHHLTSALRLYPTHPEYNFIYARELRSQDRLDEALGFAQRAVKYNYLPETSSKYKSLVLELHLAAEGSSDK